MTTSRRLSKGSLRPEPARARYATRRSHGRRSYGDAVVRVAEALGYELLPWQRQVASTALEVDPDTGLLAYRTVIVTVPRQSGKTTLLLAVAAHRALAFQTLSGPQSILYTAQTGLDARTKFVDDWLPVLDRSPLAGQYTKRLTNGQEQVRWRNGSRLGIAAPTNTAVHGRTLDLGFVDEAFSQVDDRLEQAFGPAMITRQQPQLWVVSTAGTDESTYLNSKVELGREMVECGITSDVAYFEFSADPDTDPGDVRTWISCMPALKHEGNPNGTAPVEAVAAQYASMPLPEFRRAYLNLRDSRRSGSVISPADWQACEDTDSALSDPITLAFDVAPDRGTAAIGAAGLAADGGGNTHVEVVEHASGTGWVVGRIVELVERHKPAAVVCDAAGPASSLLADMAAAGVEVRLANTREAIQAAGAFYDDAVGHRLRHIGQIELTTAVDGAAKRSIGESWAWGRKSSAVDISPLVAVTLARWGHKTVDGFDPADGVF